MSSHVILVTVVAAISGGVLLTVVARRLGLPVIVALLLGGWFLGPEGLGVIQPENLGDGLAVLVSLAVGLILFEGGLTLDLAGYRQAPTVIRRLLTVGVVATWLTTALAIRVLFGYSLDFALLAGSLVIVTGPTVIAPLLKRIQVQDRLHHILHWEGVLIDPIGVFIAVLCFEAYGQLTGPAALGNLVFRIATGLAVGVVGALLLAMVMRRRWVPADMANVTALGGAVAIYGGTEVLGHALGFSEAGLLSVVVAGLVLGWLRPEQLHQVRRFKAELTDLLIGLLFVLLVAGLNVEQFVGLGVPGLLLVAVVLLVVRPLAVLLSAHGTGLTWRERLFLGWVAPRGIVAASMASLFALRLGASGEPLEQARFVETFTYSVIAATVLLHGLTAGPLVRLLGLRRSEPVGWLVVGAHAFGRAVARSLGKGRGVGVVLLDTNPQLVAGATAMGLQAFVADARDPEALETVSEMAGVGNLLALTDNEDLNALLCQRWAEAFGAKRVFCWRSGAAPGARQGRVGVRGEPGRVVWSGLPKPSVLSAELDLGEAAVVEEQAAEWTERRMTTPLLQVNGGAVTLDPTPNLLMTGTVLTLRREGELLRRSLRTNLVVTSTAVTLEGVLRGAPRADRRARTEGVPGWHPGGAVGAGKESALDPRARSGGAPRVLPGRRVSALRPGQGSQRARPRRARRRGGAAGVSAPLARR